MANERRFDCNLCIHMNVCPAYEVTQTECQHYIPQGNVIPVIHCKDCKHYAMWSDGRAMNHCDKHDRTAYDDGFCSYGKKSGTQPQREDV